MPPNKETASTTERLLGQMVAEIKALGDRLDRNDDHFRELRAADRVELGEIKKDVEELKAYMLRVEGGKKMLVAMLSLSGAFGAVVWEVISRLLPYVAGK